MGVLPHWSRTSKLAVAIWGALFVLLIVCALNEIDLGDHGYIELLLVEDWRFEFAAHDAMRGVLTDRVGASSSRLKSYEFGEIVAAMKADHTYILFLEIIRTVK
jgi:hypothetical protein